MTASTLAQLTVKLFADGADKAHITDMAKKSGNSGLAFAKPASKAEE